MKTEPTDLPTLKEIEQWRDTINTFVQHGDGRIEIDGFEFRKYLAAARRLHAIRTASGVTEEQRKALLDEADE